MSSRQPRNYKVLNVAEKNDAAKRIADILSNHGFNRREGFSCFNKIYEFDYFMLNQQCQMIMTSLSGHLLGYEFEGAYQKWYGCHPVSLFEANLRKQVNEGMIDIKRTLEKEVRSCNALVVWTDCDREGENIGFEVIDICRNIQPKIQIYRAKFSEITLRSVTEACRNLAIPDEKVSNAVDVRQELDLRIGAAFTRFQTLRLQKVFPNKLSDRLISYGSCQFPTLGFVVERYKARENFQSEAFWKIEVDHSSTTADGERTEANFTWKRNRLFNELACEVLHDQCMEEPRIARVVDIKSKPKRKWRPVAMDTVELEKLSSRKLRINAKETMKIAEKLYTQGFISYPRTETNIFPKDINLSNLVEEQTQHSVWGSFAQRILELNGGPIPRNGNKTDKAHPPIHPTNFNGSLSGNEAKVYELIVRHFLACCHRDAEGHETTVEIELGGERFTAHGLAIIARNYLEVYPYDRWNAKVIPVYHMGEEFEPTRINLRSGETNAPPLLSEADLISLMDKHGIGTDATHAEHIETIKQRMYVGLSPDQRFLPGELGMGLVEGYDLMGYTISKPELRAELEADLQKICNGHESKDVVLHRHIHKYKTVFEQAVTKADRLDAALAHYFGNPTAVAQAAVLNPTNCSTPLRTCPRCDNDMVIKQKRDGGFMVSCMGYPDCKCVAFLPNSVQEISVDDSMCRYCNPPVHNVKLKLKRGSVPAYFDLEQVSCICGCDENISNMLNIRFRNNTPSNNGAANRGNNGAGNRGNNGAANRGNNGAGNRGNNGAGNRGNNGAANRGNNGAANRGNNGAGNRGNNGAGNRGNNGAANRGNNGAGNRGNNGAGNRGNNGAENRGNQRRNQPPATGVLQSRNQNTRCSPGVKRAANGKPKVPSTSSNYHQEENQPGTEPPKCNCGAVAIELTVRKDGPNQGRQFYKCGNSGSCDFFSWAEPPERNRARPPQQRQSGPSNNGYSQGNSSTTRQRKPPTCGNCREVGHNKRNCPNK